MANLPKTMTEEDWKVVKEAWGRGEAIQYWRTPIGMGEPGWHMWPFNTRIDLNESPYWRVEPEPIKLHYRNALMQDGNGNYWVRAVNNDEDFPTSKFVRWIGERQIIEVEVLNG
jgi:hypothetical protein